jgi:uncharacterized protein
VNPDLNAFQWLLAAIAALSVGLAKSGFAGIGIVAVILMATILPARESTGALLPLLIAGDVFALIAFRKHAQWHHVLRLLPPAVIGVAIGWKLMRYITDTNFRPVLGWIVLLMVVLEVIRRLRPLLFEQVPHSRWFAWTIGGWTGITTMLANAAGPVMTLYLLAVNLPKLQFVGTSAYFFLILNISKLPFSYNLGLINPSSLTLNAALIPVVGLGIFSGRTLIQFVPERVFVILVLSFAALAALRLIVS